jgi:hypothetical protein
VTGPPSDQRPFDGRGLCGGCRHARLVTSARGSSFVMCGLSLTDDRFAKYPRLPVLACGGFEAPERPREAQGHQR